MHFGPEPVCRTSFLTLLLLNGPSNSLPQGNMVPGIAIVGTPNAKGLPIKEYSMNEREDDGVGIVLDPNFVTLGSDTVSAQSGGEEHDGDADYKMKLLDTSYDYNAAKGVHSFYFSLLVGGEGGGRRWRSPWAAYKFLSSGTYASA